MPPPRPLPKDRRSGFALLITITLLAFLVLLLVSLASLTRVETQVASNTQQLSKARQNALMALNVALGQLQLMLGPDQRVTAPAAQQGDGTVSYASADVDNNANWVGVYRQDPTTTTRSPQLLNWLVSGNQTLTVPVSGANTPSVVPNSIVTGISSTTTVATPVTVGGKDAVLLVGPASVTSSNSDRFVVAPLQNIQVPEKTLPGLDPTSSTLTTIGRYAYWGGDEGVKAKVSLSDPWAASANADEKSYRLKGAQRSGIESVDKDDTTIPATSRKLDTAYPANTDTLPKILDLKQLPMANAAGQTALTNATQNRFHDLTAASYSVLADVALGGLKKDLTAWLAYPTASLATGAPADADPIFAQNASDTTGYGLPKWGIIRSYAGLQGGTTNPLAAQTQTDQRQGFGPVVTYFRLGFSAYSPTPTPATAESQLIVQAFPVLVLWNPYNTPIAANPSYEFVFGFRWNDQLIKFSAGNPPTTFKGSLVLSSSPRLITGIQDPTTLSSNGSNTTRKFMRFTVNSPQIAPGESLVFTLDSSGDYVAPGQPGAIELSSGNVVTGTNVAATDRSVYFRNPLVTLTPAQRAQKIRVFINGSNSSIQSGPWLQMGLYPGQTAGSDPTVQDMVNQDPYMLLLSIKPGSFPPGSDINVLPAPATNPSGYVWMRSQMPGYDTSTANQYYTNTRWLAQLNPRAPYHYTMSPGAGTGGTLSMIGDNSQSNANGVPIDKFDGNKASAGPTINASLSSTPTTTNLQIAELTSPSLQPESRFFSLAQLQHANLSLMAQTPGNAVGNSEVNPITKDQTVTGIVVTLPPTTPSNDQAFPANQVKWFYDTSYLLNQALWDHYFFSTVPHSPPLPPKPEPTFYSPEFHLPNARHVFYEKDGVTPTTALLATDKEAFNTAAAGLLVNGGFNVNSTSEQAWRALLASHNGLDSANAGVSTHPYSRFSSTKAGDPANTTDWTSGYRILSNAQINLLAQKIVTEVKTRGPFLSLADFVNRRLKADATGLKGALQAAIDATDSDATTLNRINDVAPFNSSTYRVNAQAYYPTTAPSLLQKQLFLADFAADNTRPASSRAAFAPGFLTQADLLNSLGPVLTARSDTFRIRAYGDVQNPTTTNIEGKAWCEAIVQRVPDYVENTVDAWTTPGVGTPSATFGRRFKIVSFRWLSPNDI